MPYFKAGLRRNEYCVWVNSLEQLYSAEVMKIVGSLFAWGLKNNRLERIPYTSLYLEDGVLNMQKVFKTMAAMLKQALEKGYDGIRISGHLPWHSRKEWVNLTDYEAEVNKSIPKCKIIALCLYPIAECRTSEFIDVMTNHPCACIVQEGEMVLLQSKTSREMNRQFTSETSSIMTPLQTKFAVSGLNDFSDKEIIELVLSLCPDGLRQGLPVRLIKTFKNIRGLISASPEKLAQAGIDKRCISVIRLLKEVPTKVLEEKIAALLSYQSPKDIFDYLSYSMLDLKKKVFKVIFLNNRNQIIKVDDLFTGTLDRIVFNPRNVIEDAIEYEARAFVFVHNHPSGNLTPS